MAKVSMQGMWASALRRSVQDRAPSLLKALKQDQSGKVPLRPQQREAAMVLLRKVMTAKQIKEKLGSKPVATTRKPSAPKKAKPKRRAQ